MSAASKTTSRTSYHHGDLRNALTEAAVDLARTGGPNAVVLREVARRVGVSATAAYRHFATHDDLLEEVKHAALSALYESISVALAEALAGVPAEVAPGDLAETRLRAAAEGYIAFAAAQPGLFNTAFCHTAAEEVSDDLVAFTEVDSFQLLGRILDELVAAGRIEPARRPGADVAAWAAVHGFSVLLVDGPLRNHLTDEQRAFVQRQTVDMIIQGLKAPAGASGPAGSVFQG